MSLSTLSKFAIQIAFTVIHRLNVSSPFIVFRIKYYMYLGLTAVATIVSRDYGFLNYITSTLNNRRGGCILAFIAGLRGGEFRDWNKWHSWTKAIFRGSRKQHYCTTRRPSLHALQSTKSTKHSEGKLYAFIFKNIQHSMYEHEFADSLGFTAIYAAFTCRYHDMKLSN